jgi:phospholipase/lecithinase/hemolysin
MNLLKKHVLAAGVALLPFLFPVEVRAATFSQIYAFGDSLSDTGNTFNRTLRLYPGYPYFRGRFSNGPLWVEYVAEGLGLDFNRQTNFAYGGTTTGEGDTVPLLEFPGLQRQVRNFVADHPVADPNALYVVWSGANDYLYGDVTNSEIAPRNLATAVTSLAQAGARTILVGNLPDLGQLPSTRRTNESIALDLLSNEHNSTLAELIQQTDQSLPQVNLLTLDVDSLFAEVRLNPSDYGFSNVTRACISVFSCLLSPRQQSRFLFWDDVHPTTAGHQQIAQLALDVLAAPLSTSDSRLGAMPPQARSAEAIAPLISQTEEAATTPEPMAVAGLLTFTVLAVRLRHKSQCDRQSL